MKRFLLKIIGFVSLILVLGSILYCPYYFCSPKKIADEFYGVDSEKRNKIVLVGSSNLTFNFDYIELNKTFENYDVIGSHYPLTVGFLPLMTKVKKLNISSDDIVVFCLPFHLYEKEVFINFYEKHPQKVMSRELIIDALKYNTTQTLSAMIQLDPIGYYRFFNKEKENYALADTLITFNLERNFLMKKGGYLECEIKNDGEFMVSSLGFDSDYLNSFFKSAQNELGCKVYFRFPAIRRGYFEIDKGKLNFMENSNYYINKFESSVYDSAFFFNHRYHLNKCGAEINTSNLIDELKPIIKN